MPCSAGGGQTRSRRRATIPFVSREGREALNEAPGVEGRKCGDDDN